MARPFPSRAHLQLLVVLLIGLVPAGCTTGDSSTDPDTPPTPVATTVSIDPGALTLEAGGETAQLSATVRDQMGDVMPDASVTWTSNASGVVSIGVAGRVTSGTTGSAEVTAASGDASGTAAVTVVPRPVATVQVTPISSSIEPGESVQLSATVRDASGGVLAGRTVAWQSSNPNIASVTPGGGLVTGESPGGPITITATSEGVSGTAQVSVEAPITAVTLTGRFRVKVGDTYTYTATAELADGTAVDRPMTWSIQEAGKGTMTAAGTLTPLGTGTITIQVTIDGQVWQATLEAYDWLSLSGSGNQFLSLDADIEITNKFGSSEYAELVLSCSSTGTFFIWVHTEFFVTENGGVAYAFDGGAITTQTWIEFDDFSALGHPGPTNLATKSLALTMAGARLFLFGFTEFQGPVQTMAFRVTGLAPLLQPLLNACPGTAVQGPAEGPSGGLRTGGERRSTSFASVRDEYRALTQESGESGVGRAPSIQRESEVRDARGPRGPSAPAWETRPEVGDETRSAVRVR